MAWRGARPLHARAGPAPRELWRLVSDLSGEHFQLRGVDDARFILSRLGPWSAAEFAAALEDDDPYVRLHVAQVLERMGPVAAPRAASRRRCWTGATPWRAPPRRPWRRSPRGPPRPPSPPASTGTPPHEVRVALVRGSGAPRRRRWTGCSGCSAPVRPPWTCASRPPRPPRGGGGQPVSPVARLHHDPPLRGPRRRGGPRGPVGRRLRGRGRRRPQGEAWGALGPQQAIIHTAEQAADRRARRAALLVEHLGADGFRRGPRRGLSRPRGQRRGPRRQRAQPTEKRQAATTAIHSSPLIAKIRSPPRRTRVGLPPASLRVTMSR